MDVESKTAQCNPVYSEAIDANSIRLLRIWKSRDGGFSGKLKVFRLSNAPPFNTASYTWGAKTYADTCISFGSGTLPILGSLVPFLRMISVHRNFNDDDWWWIDSLCINLADSQEREGQVQIMAEIYRRARRAVVWLGDKNEQGSDCTGAIEFLHHLGSLSLAFDRDESIRSDLRGPGFSAQWTAVSNLLARKWWSRVWTLQEFILPREAKLYCGNGNIGRGKFKSAMYSIFLCSTGFRELQHELIPRSAFDSAFNRRRIHQWYNNPQTHDMSLVSIMAYLGNHSASDSRDRIYSVLGLITERDRSMVGNPEYMSSVQQQYAKLVRSFWNEHRSLDIICFSHIFNRYSGPADLALEAVVPTWAPDWRVHTEYASPVPLMASQSASEHIGNFRPLSSQKWKAMYDAPGNQLRGRANVRFHDNLKEMWCDGVVLDTIDVLGALQGCEPRCTSYICVGEEPIHGILQGMSSSDALPLPDTLELLDAIARSLVLDRQDKYLRFFTPQNYVSDFIVLCQACLEGGGSVDAAFSTWFENNRALHIGEQTLESLIVATTCSGDPTLLSSSAPPTLRPTSTMAHPPHTFVDADADDADTFLSRFQDTVRKKSRRIMVTSRGHVGMAPCRTRLDDAVVILFGCNIPLVLRRVGTREAWQVIGEAYVHGYMNGQVEKLVWKEARNVHQFRLV